MGKFPKYNYSIAQEKTNKNVFCAKLVFVYRNACLPSIIRKTGVNMSVRKQRIPNPFW